LVLSLVRGVDLVGGSVLTVLLLLPVSRAFTRPFTPEPKLLQS